MTEDMKEEQNYKLFVGNVPFKCSLEEFTDVFKDMQGFMRAELIYRVRSKLTRGFGFVEFETDDDLTNVMETELFLSERMLRMNRYSDDMRNVFRNQDDEPTTFKLFARNVGNTTVDDLREYFSRFGDVSECYVLLDRETKEPKGHGVVGFTNKENLDEALEDRDVNLGGNKVLVFPFRYRQKVNKFSNQKKFTGNKQLYRQGHEAGFAVGYDQGYEEGYSMGYEDHEAGNERNSKKNYLKRPFLKNVVNNTQA